MRIAAPLLLSTALILIGWLAGRQNAPPQGDRAAPTATAAIPTYQQVCQQCHGPSAEGNAELKSPSIAGQPSWYLKEQLEKFRRGHRGTDPRDIHGQQMRAIALSLSEGDIDEATDTAAAFPSLPTSSTLRGDAGRGQEIYDEQCIDCHRYNGSGEKVFGSSPLTSFQDWYLAGQIEKFRGGLRGYHEDDEKGQQMRHLLSYLKDGDSIDLAAYIASLAIRYPPDTRPR